nr:hypothetical protein [Tanacetum cinerariifolium]
MGDGSITLGPQGGLARGWGQTSMQRMPLHDGPNGFGSIPDRAVSFDSNDGLGSRYMPKRPTPHPGYPSSIQEKTMNYVNRDTRHTRRGFDQVRSFSPPEGVRVSTLPQSGSSIYAFLDPLW